MTPADELTTAAKTLRALAPFGDKRGPLAVWAPLADLLDTAADYVAEDAAAHPTHLVRALAVARAINTTGDQT